jgi:hypothetical protein
MASMRLGMTALEPMGLSSELRGGSWHPAASIKQIAAHTHVRHRAVMVSFQVHVSC